jgi:cystathionine beta-lyase
MYNFDKTANRLETSSLKWMYPDVLPMWVADMDFDTLDIVKDAIKKRVDLGALGYTNTPDYYFDAFRDFWIKRHHVDFKKEWMIFSTGVVPAISSIVRRVTKINDRVLVLTPTYNIFFNSIINNHREVSQSDLIYDGKEYKIDWKDFEARIKNGVRMLILCNPQNPVGKIWSRGEIERIGKICYENNVVVLSDEIHCDIVTPGMEYIPFASVNDINKQISITCISASKCFNLAGLQGACVVIPNEKIRKLVNRGLNTDEVAEGNAFVYDAFSVALNKGEAWLDEMNKYVYNNKKILRNFLNENLKDLDYHFGDATYLAWVDCKRITDDTKFLCEYLKDKAKVYFSYGEEYGVNFKTFIRINLATSKENVIEGLNRLLKGINLYKEEYNK